MKDSAEMHLFKRSTFQLLALVSLVAGFSALGAAPTNVYRIIQGHDGNPDPDDNLAQLAGLYAIYRNHQENPSQIQMVGIIYGDTKQSDKTAMKTGNGTGAGNYGFFKQYALAAHKTIYPASAIHDCVTQAWNFDAIQPGMLTSAGEMTYNEIVAAINNKDATRNYRVVYSAGGGQNASYEAIRLLLKNGYSSQQIKDHYAIVQHGKWNLDNACEGDAKAGTMAYTIRISDQNQYSGTGKTPKNVTAAATSDIFKKAWDVARGNIAAAPAIPHFVITTDASDAGSHHFASNLMVIEANWNMRNNESAQINYKLYNTAEITTDLNQGTTGIQVDYHKRDDTQMNENAAPNFIWGARRQGRGLSTAVFILANGRTALP